MKHIAVTALALGMLVGASTAAAQGRPMGDDSAKSWSKGVMLGIRTVVAPGITIRDEDDEEFKTELGGGLGLQVGYGFTPMFMAFLGIDLARQGSGIEDLEGDFGVVHAELGGRANFPLADQRLMPYVTAAVGARTIGAEVEDDGGDEFDLSLSGGMLSVGGGVQYFVSPSLALEGGASLSFGKFDQAEVDGEEEDLDVDASTSTRIRVGVNWYP